MGIPVAPYTGAWIEIEHLTQNQHTLILSHPTRVRGLKYKKKPTEEQFHLVAPYTGAWIEIVDLFDEDTGLPSHPTRVRGLKFLMALS